jgi:hypothetical protein
MIDWRAAAAQCEGITFEAALAEAPNSAEARDTGDAWQAPHAGVPSETAHVTPEQVFDLDAALQTSARIFFGSLAADTLTQALHQRLM